MNITVSLTFHNCICQLSFQIKGQKNNTYFIFHDPKEVSFTTQSAPSNP